MKLLYDQDFYEWTQRSADLLRRGCYAELDMEHIAEELADMGGRERSQLGSRIERILEHKLKLLVCTGPLLERNSAKWAATVFREQLKLKHLLGLSPSLRRDVDAMVLSEYRDAAKLVKIGVPDRSSEPPERCPWTVEEILGSSEE